jgi:hypothetical protein
MGLVELEVLFSAAPVAGGNGRGWVVAAKVAYIPTKNVGTYAPPASVHQMILALEARGLIARTPGQARSIQLLIPREELPDLE